MASTFNSCISLKNLNTTNWNVSKVTDMSGMFMSCENLITIGNTTNWDVSKVTTMERMFSGCASLEELNVSNWDVSKVTTMERMFAGCNVLTSIGDTTNWNPAYCMNMTSMFSGCTSLEELNVSNWDVSKVTTFYRMFSCGNNYGQVPIIIKKLNVSKWDTSSATDMSFMFYGCRGPKTIDVSDWDVSKVTNFDHMFAHSYLTLTGVDNWAPSTACTNVNAMFHSIQNTRIDVSKYNTSKVTVFDQMFQSADKLTKITGLENFDTSAGLGFSEMFRYCSSLKELDLSSFDTTKAKDGAPASANGSYTTTMSDMFTGATSLSKITLGENFSFNGDGTTTDPSHHALLPTPASGFWYSSDGTAYAPADVPSRKADTYYATADREDGKINWVKLMEIYHWEGLEMAWLYYKRMTGGGS
jgi:surface protein